MQCSVYFCVPRWTKKPVAFDSQIYYPASQYIKQLSLVMVCCGHCFLLIFLGLVNWIYKLNDSWFRLVTYNVPQSELCNLHFYRPQRSCDQGNAFTGICDSVNRGGLPQCMLGSPPPRKAAPPSPRKEIPPGRRHPHRKEAPPSPAYGQWAAGTHPTGCKIILLLIFIVV